jgi:hypothetical protein
MRSGIRACLAAMAGCLALSGIVGTSTASAAPGTASSSSPAVVPAAKPASPLSAAALLAAAASSQHSSSASVRVFKVGADQRGAAAGTLADITVANPHLASADALSLAEISVQSADESQGVAIGWMVDRGVFHNTRTHFFTLISINGRLSSIDANFQTARGSSCPLGKTLSPGGQQLFDILQGGGGWQVLLDGKVCGQFPNSLWHNEFTHGELITWLGAVEVGTSSLCAQMGNGKFASSPAAAEFAHIEIVRPDGATEPPARLSTTSTQASLYSGRTINRTTFRFGGPGACH